ncbi:MAG: 4-hydroxythreonine-4-phosphate dehydrogenase PdxA [Planctomycetota bacterium]|nr:4-hydroxythreonine-4-phosphate dehydrogenase PdxA [Planctomycetota bacterium]
MISSPLVIAVTMGDRDGIGPEVLVKALSKLIPQVKNVKFLIFGDSSVLRKVQRRLRIKLHERLLRAKEIPSAFFSWKTPVFCMKDITDDIKENLSTAVSLIRRNVVSALVTMPARKVRDGKRAIGHTELLAQITGAKEFGMLFFHEKKLRIMPLSLHIPLRDVSGSLSIEKVVSGVRLLSAHLESDFSIKEPKIGLSALNPHSGEGGFLGEEEESILSPSVAQLQKEGIRCIGPHNSYELVVRMLRGELDGVVALYHDQALVPFKILFGNRGVNITLGIGIIRTSPLHGTADDIVGLGVAEPQGAIDAIVAAIRLVEQKSRLAKEPKEV